MSNHFKSEIQRIQEHILELKATVPNDKLAIQKLQQKLDALLN
jgi:hypothetical protein